MAESVLISYSQTDNGFRSKNFHSSSANLLWSGLRAHHSLTDTDKFQSYGTSGDVGTAEAVSQERGI